MRRSNELLPKDLKDICNPNLFKFETTKELVDVIASSVGAKYYNLEHPERRIFQAIRIEVNDELKVIEEALPKAIKMLNKGGRICYIRDVADIHAARI